MIRRCIKIARLLNIKKGRLFSKYRFRCNYCGNEEYALLWLLKLKLIFSNKIYRNCSKCHKKNAYYYFFHLYHESSDPKEKEFNRKNLWDKRML